MKKTLMTLAIAATCMGCANAQHSLTVKLGANINDTVQIQVVDKQMRSIESQETVIAKDGTVTYDFKGDKARLAMINMRDGMRPIRMQAFLVPGEEGTLTMNNNGGTWSGTKFYTELAQLESITDPIEGEITKLMEDFQTKAAAGANNDSLQQAVMPAYQALMDKINAANKDFIKNNPNSNVCLTIIAQMEDPEESFNLLSADIKKGVFSDIADGIQARIDKDKAMKEAAKGVADGCVAPDFTLNDINGKPLALSSLRGKYLILDFWGSWCGWCIKGFPEMKKAYAKYNGKLEILGVDCNDTEQKWKDAVAKHELPWKHVFNPRSTDILTTYAIQGFPTKIIIDPQGKIVKTVVGEDPQFYTILDELMK